MVRPIVVVNGSTDGTAEIARSLGVDVIETEIRGKMPALQLGLRSLGERALEPFILLDADTKPIPPRLWHSSMLNALKPKDKIPCAISGPAIFMKNPNSPTSSRTSAAMRSVYRQAHGTLARIVPNMEPAYYGPNQAYKLGDKKVLDAVLALNNIWPEEDLAMAKTIENTGGTFTQCIDGRMTVITPESVAFPSLGNYIKKPTSVHEDTILAYRRDAPSDSQPLGREDEDGHQQNGSL